MKNIEKNHITKTEKELKDFFHIHQTQSILSLKVNWN